MNLFQYAAKTFPTRPLAGLCALLCVMAWPELAATELTPRAAEHSTPSPAYPPNIEETNPEFDFTEATAEDTPMSWHAPLALPSEKNLSPTEKPQPMATSPVVHESSPNAQANPSASEPTISHPPSKALAGPAAHDSKVLGEANARLQEDHKNEATAPSLSSRAPSTPSVNRTN